MMPGITKLEMRDAIIDAYTPQSLEMSVAFLLNEKLDVITPPGEFGFRAFKLVEWAEMNGRDVELVRAIGKDRPRSAKVQQLYHKYGMAIPIHVQNSVEETPITVSSDLRLERIVRPQLSVPDIAIWRESLTRIEGQVCRLTLNGDAKGTGFLIGPDVVLTNYHVLETVINEQAASTAVECQFDFKRLKDGSSPYTPIRLAENWLVDYSPYSNNESCGITGNPFPSIDELDYAIVRLTDPIGSKPWAQSPGNDAPARGWITLPKAARPFKSPMGLIIAQHPDGQPMKLAIDSAAIDRDKGFWLNDIGTRVRYTTNTEAGSSGSPCFDFDWNLVALHHSGDPKNSGTKLSRFGDWNQGVPIVMIHERILRTGKYEALEG